MNTATDTASPPAPSYAGLFGPWADLLLLGGASVLLFFLFAAIQLDKVQVVQLAGIMLLLANLVNHPHFAFSYQLFYGSWREVKSGQMPPDLRRRWWLAGVIAPALLALALLAGAILWSYGYKLLIGLLINAMGILVGWHYVKQGFGMAMMDAALKKRYWPAPARQALLYNAYACWAAAWALGNNSPAGQALWGVLGIPYVVPGLVASGIALLAGGTTVWAGLQTYRTIANWHSQQLSWKQWPLAGLLAYVISIYFWLGLVWHDAAAFFVIPFFHSLQYMTVVWRYKKNEAATNHWGKRALAGFALYAVVLGALGFWLIPAAVDIARTGVMPRMGAGVALGMACFWLFINVHHYLIDNVLWRQGNPKVKQYLFDAAPVQPAK
jgi:hypothetical protein